jgi:hypothetical protein
MSGVWKTKYGMRRVRQDPPTLEEAIFAARGLTDDLDGQIEIAASLMGIPPEEVRVAALKAAQRKDVKPIKIVRAARSERAVVVEHKTPRRRIINTMR